MSKAPLFKVPAGSCLVLDGRSWRVTGRDGNGYTVEGLEDGECITLPLARVDRAIRAGACEVIKPAEAEERHALRAFTGGYERFEQLSEQQQATVRARLPAVLAILQLEEEGIKLTQRAMSRDKQTGEDGPVRKMVKRRAREIAQEDRVLGAKRGGRITTTFDWPEGRTLRKYADLFLRFGRNPVVLLDRDHLKGPQGEARRRLSAVQEHFIQYVINLWHDERKPKLAPLALAASTQFKVSPEEVASGFWFPSITTIRTRLKAISEVVKTLGRSGLRQGANLKGAGSTDIRALMYGEKWEKDEAYLSIFTDGKGVVFAKEVDPKREGEELDKNEIARLWLHFVIDVATRLPLAWVIADSADADHSLALLRMATRDKTKEKVRYGCKHDPAPAAGLLLVSADNGSATRNGTVYAAQLGIGGITMTGRTYHATDKPYVERPFGTLQWQVLNFMDGYTGSRPGELEGYDPMDNARHTHDELYKTITQYFIDEYPFREHRGTGMFQASPWQKFDEVRDTYGGIEPPSQRTRCLHLGIKREMHTTEEGVNPFNIPFNSTALQKFAGGLSKAVTVHIDPDLPRRVYITAKGHAEVLEAELSMTAFNDLTLQEILDLQEATAKANPEKRAFYNEQYLEALKRRSRDSGFFPDPRSPSSYRTIEQLQKQADRLAKIEVRPVPMAGQTVAPGSIMDRSGKAPAYRVGTRSASLSPPSASVSPSPPQTSATDEAMKFTPVKDSKL